MALPKLLASAAVAALVATTAQAVSVSTTEGTQSDPESLLPSTDPDFALGRATAGEATVDGAKLMEKTVTTAAAPTEDQVPAPATN